MLKTRYLFFGLCVLLWAMPFLVPGYIASHPHYLSLSSLLLRSALLVLLAFVLYFIDRVERNTKIDAPLTTREKAIVVLTELFVPIVAAGFYYYCWKRRLPTKARQANMCQWIIYGVAILVVVASWAMTKSKV